MWALSRAALEKTGFPYSFFFFHCVGERRRRTAGGRDEMVQRGCNGNGGLLRKQTGFI